MTRTELETALASIGVHTNSYSLDGIQHSDCVCLLAETGRYRVCYVERDKPAELESFDSLEDAYAFVYETFCKWHSTQQR